MLDLGVIDGKRVRRSAYAESKAEAIRQLDKLKGDARLGLEPSKISLDEWFRMWPGFENLSPTTQKTYRDYWRRYVKDELGPVKLAALKPQQIRALARSMEDRGLSARTVTQMLAIIQRLLKLAVDERLLDHNPAQVVAKPKQTGGHHASAESIADAYKMLDAAPDAATQARLAVGLLCGLRQSEALGLRRMDVDLGADVPVIHVTSTLQHVSGEWVRKPPKSARGVRDVPLIAAAESILRTHFESLPDDPEQLLFTRPSGEPIHAKADHTAWWEECDRAGVKRFSPHGSRATAATDGAGRHSTDHRGSLPRPRSRGHGPQLRARGPHGHSERSQGLGAPGLDPFGHTKEGGPQPTLSPALAGSTGIHPHSWGHPHRSGEHGACVDNSASEISAKILPQKCCIITHSMCMMVIHPMDGDSTPRRTEMATYNILPQLKKLNLVDPAELVSLGGRYWPDLGEFEVQGGRLYDRILAHAAKLQQERSAASTPSAASAQAPLATERQLSYIRSLIARRRREGTGGGFMAIPSEAELTTLTRRDASAPIDSLRDSY